MEKNLNPGQEVRPDQMLAGLPQFGAPLFVITEPTRLWVQLDATESDLCHLKPGLPMVIRSQALPEASHPGRLEVVSDSFDPATRMLRVRGSVENPDRTLKAEEQRPANRVDEQQPRHQLSISAVVPNVNPGKTIVSAQREARLERQ